MDWQPAQDNLATLAQYLRDSLSGHDITAQKQAEMMLKQAKNSPDFNNYLAYLIASPSPSSIGLDQTAYHSARSAAALYLKNNVKNNFKTVPQDSVAYIKATVPTGLRDSNAQIRNFAGNVITEVVRQGGILGWTQIVPDIVSMVASEEATPDMQDGAMSALFKICEDNKKALDKEYEGSGRPLAFLLPKLLEFVGHPNDRVRSKALSTINIFLNEPVATTCADNIGDILQKLVQQSQDPKDDVRRAVCRAFALLADGLPDALVPHVEGVVEYTLSQQRNVQNQELALDAAEFFFEASSTAVLRDALGPQLPQIVPVLLECMIYSEDDQLRFMNDEDDAEEEDEEKDIKPQFATSKTSKGGAGDAAGATSQQANGNKVSDNGFAYEDDELSEGEIEEDDDDYEIDPEEEWNLRKCSAATLDSLASHFHGSVFEVTLPWLMENLSHRDWQNREAAVLALGAIGPGCMDVIRPHLPQLVPYLISLLKDEQAVVRQISCWALSRFANWASQLDPAGKQEFFEPMMDGILQRMLDNNKKVQGSAASSFAILEESAGAELMPYCSVIIPQFVKCFGRYKDKNMFVLYDCVQTLAEQTGPTLAQPELINALMPALIDRWQKVQDQSREMFPLLECLAFMATALGTSFTPFARPFFMRCIKIIHQNLSQGIAAEEANHPYEQPDKDFLVTSLDLLSSIVQALDEPRANELTLDASPNMFELLAYCMKDANNDVRQSAYALLGDCAIYVFPQLQPYLPTLLELLIIQLDLSTAKRDPETAFRVINNACWSCGEISMRTPSSQITPYVDRILQKLAAIIFSPSVPESLHENAAIALGRLGLNNHSHLAPHLSTFAPPFLNSLSNVAWTDEKGHAYKGFSLVVLDNPQAMEACLGAFVAEMASAPGVFLTGMQGDGPLGVFEQVLVTYKGLIGGAEGWEGWLGANLPAEQVRALKGLYSF
ncbi:hypothetical protein MBLNU230_g5049t1 [Neophaeotheca triangularis]